MPTATVILRWDRTQTDRARDERVTIDVKGELLVGDTFKHDGWIWEAVERLAASENGYLAQSDTWAFICDPVRSVA